ncbi:DUF342 domain-containing protein [Clostridium thailandense]|nr:flagellar assembly protein A [Clostridium thailandense]
MEKLYTESSLEKCIKAASEELGISEENIKYEIVEEKKSLFRKRITISVKMKSENLSEELGRQTDDGENNENIIELNENDGTVSIVNEKIQVTNPKAGGEPAYIIVRGNTINVMADGEIVQDKKSVFEESEIKIIFQENEAKRELKISISEDKLEAYATVIYIPQKIYKLKDKAKSNKITIEAEIEAQVNPTKYKVEEIKQELSNLNIVYGIIEENLKKCVEGCNEKILVAKGEPVVNGENDFIEIKFKQEESYKQLKEDQVGNVDFKSIGAIEAAHKGDILAVRHDGQEGRDGIDITGKKTKYKPGKKLKIKVGNGAIVQEQNIIVADIDGKPCVKSNVFYVYPVHEIKSDVDLKTGNIKFIGDIIVYGNVAEGMEVEGGNAVEIGKDVERAFIRAKGNISIKGNVIAAKVFGGGDDVEKLKTINDLEQLKEIVNNIITASEEIKKYNLLGENKKDGEIIKVLIENKFKLLPRICLSVITHLNIQHDEFTEDDLVNLIKCRLLGMGPISIKHYSELEDIRNSIEEKLVYLRDTLALPVNVQMSYCQDSNIQSSGDVIIFGKGEYISEITANGSIYIFQDKSVARGGILKAKNEIKCKVVGSTAGVSTKLKVEKEGHIWVDVAYQNTVFVVGTREFILDSPSKNVHAYLDSSGDIVVDKFKL